MGKIIGIDLGTTNTLEKRLQKLLLQFLHISTMHSVRQPRMPERLQVWM